ncbi:MAG: (2Fe-2S)-binding protein [Gammaproteobacteria bacterium]|nr:(2Fe-2S)-binding protein [Gammaproteobacteria bacterium]MDE0510496.1 (2Fe-2S)-binding protein [Gammaproteobacteria bacterium]
MKQVISLNVNNEAHEVAVQPYDSLLDTLRGTAGLTASKRGCDSGGCGCCTVLVDGRAVYSCMTLALQVKGRAVTTVEGLRSNGELDPIQQSFIDADAVQCGYCTCGIMMAAKQLLADNPDPGEDDIRKGISGNLCRCTGYTKIVDAIKLAAARLQAS